MVVFQYLAKGLRDALIPSPTLIYYLTSPSVRDNVLKCFVMNGVIFLGSIGLFERAILPALNWWQPSSTVQVMLFKLVYNVFWLFPIYALSFALNEVWYRSIAQQVFLIRHPSHLPPPLTYSTFLLRIADEIYRQLLLLTYIILTTITVYIPLIGGPLTAMGLSWMYAYFCFEYKWIQLKWSLEMRLRWFEERWAYFLGFGLPCAALTLVFNNFVGVGIFALIFPYFIMIANDCQPLPMSPQTYIALKPSKAAATSHISSPQTELLSTTPTWPKRIPVFAIATWINKTIVTKLIPVRKRRQQSESVKDKQSE